ncbi:Serine/threonine-protein kinase tel1 [Penicillium diatomitis]|uniref:Serine/threonine-protein kinase Tel1 n=1 Tax=Penicillium diatomitis TaxID=2819901 RepID=A0A9X0BYB6_9EURO|nr:Serine/threonine-protein kinase tel1 [Penicillium diatomitis]KAJ5489042.1 Serine/threonine-protein kinase tel1 [Penicillium diatomitis]
MGDIFMDKALTRLSSDKQKDRVDGLADLKHILQQNKECPELLGFSDKACHRIFEALFQFVATERTSYIRAKRSIGKSSSGTRLSTCASVLRTAVDIFVRNIRAKTVRAIVDHITDSIAVPREGLWEPLSVDYTKSLKCLLQYPPHTEHLDEGDWEKLMDFCLSVIDASERDDSQLSIRTGQQSTADDQLDASDTPSTPQISAPISGNRDSFVGDKTAVEETLSCIKILTNSPVAPIQSTAESILQSLEGFVSSSPRMAANAHQLAFSSINTAISRVMFDQSELVRSNLCKLVPTVRKLWNTKLQALKEELLVNVMLYLATFSTVTDAAPLETHIRLIQALSDCIHAEYLRRHEREILQLDDVIFHMGRDASVNLIHGPRLGSSRSVYGWTLLWILAELLKLLESVTAHDHSHSTMAEASTKRVRLSSAFEDVFRHATSGAGMQKICALQLVPFLEDKMDMNETEAFVQKAIPSIVDDSSSISSWTMVALTSIVKGSRSRHPRLKAYWPQAVDLAIRAFSSSVTSRPACNFLDAIFHHDLLEHSSATETMLSMLSSAKLNGPSSISDSALEMWATIAHKRLSFSPGVAHEISQQVCAWLRDVWSIGRMSDRLQTAQIALFARPISLLKLLMACSNCAFGKSDLPHSGSSGLIARTWLYLDENRSLLRYLFDSVSEVPHHVLSADRKTSLLKLSRRQNEDDEVIIEFLRSKLDGFSQFWKAITGEKSFHISPDILQIMTSFCVTSFLFIASKHEPLQSEVQRLLDDFIVLWEALCDFICANSSNALYPCLEVLSPILCLDSELETSQIEENLLPLLRSLVEKLDMSRVTPRVIPSSDKHTVDLIDQPSHDVVDHSVKEVILASNRNAADFCSDSLTFQRRETIRLSLIVHTRGVDPSTGNSGSALLKYVKCLEEHDLLSAQSILPAFFRRFTRLSRENLIIILETIAERCLQSYEMARCEASHTICVRMMTELTEIWSKSSQDDLTDSATDLYSWFVECLIGKQRATTRVNVAISELVQKVIDLCPSFGKEGELPSPRTIILTILQQGDIQVKFSIAEFLPSLFQQFLFRDHDAVFEDVLESLPRDPDWVEGIAIRLLVLSKLASKWHTLLRRSVYHMFETPAQVSGSLKYAQACITSTSTALGLQHARQLFRLFASQVLYTWTETHSVMSMPYSTFRYDSLAEMLNDVRDELVGQMMMRGREADVQELAAFLDVPYIEFIQSSFAKAEAYSIARDISTPPEQGGQIMGAEIRLRKLLGSESFMTQIEAGFPQIIAYLFLALDRHEQAERAYSKRPDFQYAYSIQSRISARASSQRLLPVNQQPAFRARYLLDELEFLCRCAGFELRGIWSPALAIFVCRSLLDSVHPALGALHACSVVRKIRILVCLAGPIMLENYPLEMLLNSLCSFIVDLDCAEDTIGIMWYLLEAGKPYLLTRPDFAAGICLTALVSLRRFLLSSVQNRFREEQFQEASSVAEKFHEWLCGFIDSFRDTAWVDAIKSSFEGLLSAAKRIPTTLETSFEAERDLVLTILQHRNNPQSLLSERTADLVLSILCAYLESHGSPMWCGFGPIENPATLTCSLLDTVFKLNNGREYNLWAAEMIGLSFATTGRIDERLTREQEKLFTDMPKTGEITSLSEQSKNTILRLLCDKLQVQNPTETGSIERTLQVILSQTSTDEDIETYADVVPATLMPSLLWSPYPCPLLPSLATDVSLSEMACRKMTKAISLSDWASQLALALTNTVSHDCVIGPLQVVLREMPTFAVQALPHVIHAVFLSGDYRANQRVRQDLSKIFEGILEDVTVGMMPHARLVIYCILHLRNLPFPRESTIVDRNRWLDLDYGLLFTAAHQCGLQKTALLFLEIEASKVISSSRRSSVTKYEPPVELLNAIFRNIDDPDLFYGIQQTSSLATVMEKLEYEGASLKTLLFQSANFDSDIQLTEQVDSSGVLKALNATNLQGIANSLLTASDSHNRGSSSAAMLQAATSLQQWDVPVLPLRSSPSATVFKAFQSLNRSMAVSEVYASLDTCLLTSLSHLVQPGQSAIELRNTMRALGILAEAKNVLSASSADGIKKEWQTIIARSDWLKSASYVEARETLSWHEALCSSFRKNALLASKWELGLDDTHLLEARVFRRSLEISRSHGASQASLKSAITLSKLAKPCAELGINIQAVAEFDLANVLWDQGEMTASIRMLQQLKGKSDLHKQAIPLSRAELLVTLGHHVAEARLEKPESILQDYLYPAVKELKGVSEGEAAGRVYHGFASFCDQQLHNPDGLNDYTRVKQLRDRKESELLGLEEMMRKAEGRSRESLKIFRAKAKQWFDLDDREYQRLSRSREAFLQQCLENYLLALRESETYNSDALRFCALWLDNSDSQTANKAVSRYLKEVPSRKFAPLMNQLSSRLLDVSDDFQSLLSGLVFRICAEHPYHGMYQIFASSKSRGGKDQSSQSRFQAATKLVDRLKNDKNICLTWISIHNMSISYVRFAIDKPDNKFKTGARIPLNKLPTGVRLSKDVESYKLPPPTMKIELRADLDYSGIPSIQRFSSDFTLASGVSAPKIVTAVGTDGIRYKQLFKGGNDDLRQDAIMEQVFEQVSSLLKDYQPTRQRNLGIRTYKVLPLTLHAGIIEFVPNTIPLHDYLMPAHVKYFPEDMKPSACRRNIANVQTRSFEQRVRTYRQVTENFHPVMKFFFMENFGNPDDWFTKRLAYTRSTAAISILGHVLGLGDRHGYNILLDEKTGEVVHIDLGVAFEQGRVLPVPEVVPFRLTRDLVDGFGITQTEGVFRRCCEFTLEALRQESYSIMTILDVLRYDPLYSWTLSPFRMKKMQDDDVDGDGPPVLPGQEDKGPTNEPSEADRALTVVAKKLSKTLSVTATVNELIQQATDERNLAVLYCGWAAYA